MITNHKFARIAALALTGLLTGTLFVFAASRFPASAQAVDATVTVTLAASTIDSGILVTPTATPSIMPTSNGIATYTVQPGENLFRIGLKFGLSVEALARANGILNPNVVYPGQKLIIPGISPTNPLLNPPTGTMTPISATAASTGTATVAATPIVNLTYTVQSGDNLFRIALKFHVPYTVLAQLNNLTNLNLVYIGQVLKLPSGTTLPIATTAATLIATAAATVSPLMAVTSAATSAVVDSGTTGAAVAAVNTPAAVITLAPSAAPASDTPIPPTVIITLAPSAVPPTDTPVPPSATPTNTATITATLVPTNTATSTATSTATLTPTVNKHVGFAAGVTISPIAGADPSGFTGQVTDLGVNWVQYTASWKAIEATQGDMHFNTLDSAVNAYAAAHLNVLLTLTNAPDWARPVTIENGPPKDYSTFATFASTVANRYKGKVRAYEIWSEPNLRRNWNGSPLSAANYVNLLRVANNAIKSADSGALVVSAGLAPTGFYDGVNAINDRVYLKSAYAAGLATTADAIGAHPNGWANPPDATCCQAAAGVTGWFNDRSFYFHDTLTDYRQVMKDNKDSDKQLWVTSFGWGANEGVAAANTVNTTSFGFVKFTSQAEQAQYLLRGFEIGKALGYVGPMFAYNLNACQNGLATDDALFYPCYYSLLDSAGAPRPAYTALKAMKK